MKFLLGRSTMIFELLIGASALIITTVVIAAVIVAAESFNNAR
jgi:hypothetical protein